MSTPAQVTEEHIYTTAKVGKAYVAGEDAQAAQIIADSEAKAVAEIAMVAAASADRNVSLRLERDQLRAEVERLREWQAGVIANERLHHAERKEAITRAERAEADADSTRERALTLANSLDEAQAELAQFRELDAERARMRQIAVDKRIRTPTPRTDEEAGSLIDAEEVVPADFARELEQELAAERARLRIVEEFMLRGHIPQAEDDYPQIWLGNGYFDTLADAADAAMKEETK